MWALSLGRRTVQKHLDTLVERELISEVEGKYVPTGVLPAEAVDEWAKGTRRKRQKQAQLATKKFALVAEQIEEKRNAARETRPTPKRIIIRSSPQPPKM